jgi:hypothetical protein
VFVGSQAIAGVEKLLGRRPGHLSRGGRAEANDQEDGKQSHV